MVRAVRGADGEGGTRKNCTYSYLVERDTVLWRAYDDILLCIFKLYLFFFLFKLDVGLGCVWLTAASRM